MRIISFAMWFVPPISYGLFSADQLPYGENFLYAVPCVSFRLIRNTGTESGRCTSGAAIYADVQNLLSRPMIGHTPRKLPAMGRNLPVHRSVNASGCIPPIARVPVYHNRKSPFCQGTFSIIFTKFFGGFCSCRRRQHQYATPQ